MVGLFGYTIADWKFVWLSVSHDDGTKIRGLNTGNVSQEYVSVAAKVEFTLEKKATFQNEDQPFFLLQKQPLLLCHQIEL